MKTIARAWGLTLQEPEKIWSGTDFPYQCLVDVKRTEAFRAAIHATVRPGDVVLDAGSGSGILSFFAAEAGAAEVLAVEVDPFLADCLERSIDANHLDDTIRVVRGDIRQVTLPKQIDVFICELVDTGLLDEVQAVAVNRLHTEGVLSRRTRMIPERYETFVELGSADLDYYGYRVLMPKHRWPHYAQEHAGWLSARFRPLTDSLRVSAVDFHACIDTDVERTLSFVPMADGEINAIRVSGTAHLTNTLQLGPTNAFNGDKVIPIEPFEVRRDEPLQVIVRYELSGGLSSFHVRR